MWSASDLSAAIRNQILVNTVASDRKTVASCNRLQIAGRDAARFVYYGVLVLGAATAVLVFWLAKSAIVSRVDPPIATVIAIAMGGALAWIRRDMLTPASRILLLIPTSMFAVYLITATVPVPEGASRSSALWLEYGPIIAGIAAAVSWWRPGFAATTLALVFTHRVVINNLWGIGVGESSADWAPVWDTVLFLIFGIAVIAGVQLIIRRYFSSAAALLKDAPMSLLDAFAVIVIGVHFGNYFWSAIAKLELDGGAFSWLLENRTDVLIDVTRQGGFLPIAHWADVSSSAHAAAISMVVLINAFTLVSQLACAISFWRRWSLIGITLIYDLQHVGIYLLTGIFFWKWIIFNLAIVVAVRWMPVVRIPLPVGCLGVVGMLGSIYAFNVAQLGWYDSRAMNHLYIEAITDDGLVARVPSNFFGPLSLWIARMDFAHTWPVRFPTGTWGTTGSYRVMQEGMTCSLTPKTNSESRDDIVLQLTRLVGAWHRAVVKSVDEAGRLRYDLYPHHIWSNPFVFSEFNRLDKRQIVSYRIVREITCVDGYNRYGGGEHLIDRRSFNVDVSSSRDSGAGAK